ncbi:archease [Nanoarchaeota archaeon]
MDYKYLEHTADVKFQAFGKTLEEAFINCARAYADVVVIHTDVEPKIEKNIDITSESEESLLYDFLESLIILVDSESFVLNDVLELKISKNEKYHLVAKVTGDTYDPKYEMRTHVKAVTYNEMFIKKEDKVVIQVVLDI